MTAEHKETALPLPPTRCLTRAQAAKYLGIGITLLTQVGPLPVRVGRRCVYDKVDLDRWLDEYKQRGRAIKEDLWPDYEDSTVVRTRPSGGSIRSSQTEDEYVKALDLENETTPKSF